jgi:hypothetical protein
MIARYLALTVGSERALADAFVMVGLRHAVEPEMRNASRLHANGCRAHIEQLRHAVERYGRARNADGERLRRAVFRGRRLGGFGLLRDLHDLLTLATSVHASWLVLLQGARAVHDAGLEAICLSCGAETDRQIAWLETKLRHSGAQALAVPGHAWRDVTASIPDRSEIGAVLDLVPGAALRRVVPLSPMTGLFVAMSVFVLGMGFARLRDVA